MSSSKQKTILIIDDDETMKEALNVLLQNEGYTVYNLASGHRVNAWLDTHHTDLILIDYLMPGETGAEITARLRQRPDTRTTPIIMLAATVHYRPYGYKAGVTKFIVKPFEIDYLLRQITHYLS